MKLGLKSNNHKFLPENAQNVVYVHFKDNISVSS